MPRPSSLSRVVAVFFTCVAAGYTGWIVDTPRAAGGQLLARFPDGVRGAAQSRTDPSVTRWRYATINFDSLRSREQRRMLREPSITLELFPDVTVFAEFDRFDPNTSGMTWVGHVDGVSMSTVTLVYGDGLLAGSVVMPNGVYHIRPAPADGRSANRRGARELHVVEQVDQAALTPEAPPVEVQLSAAARAAAADVPMGDSADVIDLLVVYTSLAAAHAGGQGGIANLINLGVSETNTSYANSRINQRIRLVHTAQVPYAEVSSFSTNLNNLRAGAGGLGGVPALRDAVGADLVALLVHPPSPTACGIAFLQTAVNTAFAPFAVSVTDTGCIAGFTLAHEFGHNMGARHDWYVDAGTTPFTYAHGHVNAANRWRTIMAYPDMCAELGFGCTRLLFWANPDVRFQALCDSRRVNCAGLQYWFFPGAPMGIPAGTRVSCQTGDPSNTDCDAHDSRVLNETAFTVANFRQAVIPTSDAWRGPGR